jgi:hypothetical protein
LRDAKYFVGRLPVDFQQLVVIKQFIIFRIIVVQRFHRHRRVSECWWHQHRHRDRYYDR